MKSLIAFLTATLAFVVVACAATTNQGKGEPVILKAVIHVNFADPDRQEDARGENDHSPVDESARRQCVEMHFMSPEERHRSEGRYVHWRCHGLSGMVAARAARDHA